MPLGIYPLCQWTTQQHASSQWYSLEQIDDIANQCQTLLVHILHNKWKQLHHLLIYSPQWIYNNMSCLCYYSAKKQSWVYIREWNGNEVFPSFHKEGVLRDHRMTSSIPSRHKRSIIDYACSLIILHSHLTTFLNGIKRSTTGEG